MKEQPINLVEHLLNRSKESFEEAKILSNAEHWNTTVNRLYYSCFYAASALLQKYGKSSSKHSGVRSLFNNLFIRTGILSKDIAFIFNDLFDRRQESDYGPFFTFEENDVTPWFDEVELFVKKVTEIIN